jgi:hypothetical protein
MTFVTTNPKDYALVESIVRKKLQCSPEFAAHLLKSFAIKDSKINGVIHLCPKKIQNKLILIKDITYRHGTNKNLQAWADLLTTLKRMIYAESREEDTK